MQLKQIFICVAIWAFAVATAKTISAREGDDDIDVAESNFLKSLPVIETQSDAEHNLADVSSYPYEGRKGIFATYGAPPAPQPSFGVAVNTQAVLAPHVEVLRLVEAFIQLKSEIVARFHALINDNWDLIRAVLNLIISKIQNLHSFSLKGISVVRKIMEFALNLFSEWSITLPSLTFGTSHSALEQPHETYGVPGVEAGAGFSFDG